MAQADRYDEAIAALDRVTELEPDVEWAWAIKGIALTRTGRYDEAIAALDRATEIKPDDESDWAWKGEVLRLAERYDEAVVALDRATELDPDDAWNWSCKGEALRQTNRLDDAIAALDQAISLGESSWPCYQRALCHTALDQPEQATSDFAAAIERARASLSQEPEYTGEQFNLALYLLATGQAEPALHAYQTGLALNPDDFILRDALRDLADLRAPVGEIRGLKEAERLLRERIT